MRVKARLERLQEISAAISRKRSLIDDAQEHAIIARLEREIELLQAERERLTQ